MADEKTVVKAKEEKVTFFTKVANFFKKLPSAIARPFKNMWHELRKVTWPSRPDVIKYSIIVLAFLVFMGVVIALLDAGSTALVQAITPTTKEYEDAVEQQKQQEQTIEQLKAQILANYPEGTVIDDNFNVTLPEGYVFDFDGLALADTEVTVKYPAGVEIKDGQVALMEGYVLDFDGKVLTEAEVTEKYPVGVEVKDGQVALLEGYELNEDNQVVEVETVEDPSEAEETEENVSAEETVAEDADEVQDNTEVAGNE